MTRPILAFHIILSTYGFWLPNDPRGSWSQFVAAWELLKFGKATKVTTHRSVAGCPHDREKRRAAKKVLKYPVTRFTGRHARAAATGFARACAEGSYTTLACSIMPDHAHLVVAYTPRPVEQVVAHLKGRASQQLKKDGLQPVGPVWTEGSWESSSSTAKTCSAPSTTPTTTRKSTECGSRPGNSYARPPSRAPSAPGKPVGSIIPLSNAD